MGTLQSCACCAPKPLEPGPSSLVEAVNVVRDKGLQNGQNAFPTFCLPTGQFMQLSLMLPHEDVLDKLVKPEPQHCVHFISHEWLGFSHPDPHGTQLRRMQQIFCTFADLKAEALFKAKEWEAFLQGVSAGVGRHVRKQEENIVRRDARTADDLAKHVQAGYVWLDYHSIPQRVKDETFLQAVHGIPNYVDRCDYFWICAPPALHVDLGELRDFSTWRGRGWCRLEDSTNFFNQKLKMPLVVTDQDHLSTYGYFDGVKMYIGRPDRSVFNGRFTCCRLNHRIQQPDGSFTSIPCDKDSIAPMVNEVVRNYLGHAKDQGYKHLFLFAPDLFAGHLESEKRWNHPVGESLEAFLHRTNLSLDAVDPHGCGVLGWVTSIGNIQAATEFLKLRPGSQYERLNHNWTILVRAIHIPDEQYQQLLNFFPDEDRMEVINVASDGGITALDQAAKHGFHKNARLLLELRADLESRRKDNGATPLLSAAENHYPDCLSALLEKQADIHARDFESRTALHWAVDPLAVLGNTEHDGALQCIEILLAARASLDVRDKNGKTPLEAAEELKLGAKGMSLLRAAAT
eukprot:4129688-Amphidinium_carterae.1